MSDKTILLVEDNPNDELLALQALKKSKLVYKVDVAHDGNEVLDYLFADPQRKPPDLILLDLKLPRVDGFEVLKQIRAHDLTRYVPVVVLSTSEEPKDLARTYDLGVNSYIRKLIDYSEFSESMEILVRYWLALNHYPHK